MQEYLGRAITALAVTAMDEKWDTLLATEESQRLLEQMADEALAEIEADMARPILSADDGEIAPG